MYTFAMYNYIQREEHISDIGSILTTLDLTSVPIRIRRLYWINGISPKEPRGFHAHKELNQIFVVVSGKVNLKLFQGETEESIEVNERSPYLVVPAGTWREIYAISDLATLLVLADLEYQEADYIRNWNDYLIWYKENHY